MIHIDPATLEDEAVQIELLRDDFSTNLDARQRAVEGLPWDGESQRAFVELFAEARLQMTDVEEAIGAIATLLRTVKQQMLDMDQETAAAIRRNV